MKFAFLVIGAMLAGAALAGAASAADPTVDAKLEPAEISVGQTATLTITATGAELPRIAPPTVPGLEFTVVQQSRRIQSINGVMSSSLSATYQVRAQQAGTFIIASLARGVAPLLLKVDGRGSGPGTSSTPGTPPAASGSAAPAPAASAAPGDTRLTADGAAFVRLLLPAHELYVGQSVPVEIQVGTRDGVVASLNGLPTLNGDAFTLDKLSPEPEERTAETIDGKPYTVFNWRGVLAAIKPGALSLFMQTPLTVRIPNERPSGGFLDDSSLADLFDDPAFRSFFGGATERDITVSSPPANVTVLELPAAGRPPGFSGAVGQFEISGELSDTKATAGDPLTLRLKISGAGNFDRVDSRMLADVEHWKTYQPTARFTASDTPFRGEKIFEQPVVPTEPGEQTLPALSFSYFDPATRRYETLRTAPLTVKVASAASSTASAGAAVGAQTAHDGPAPPEAAPHDAPRPDHDAAGSYSSLLPPYFQPRYVALPSLMAAAFPLAWLWLRRRERRQRRPGGASGTARPANRARLLGAMERAIGAGDDPDFFAAVRSFLQYEMSSRWRIAPEAVTLAEIEARLGAGSDLRNLFALADEALYSGRRFAQPELERWRQVALLQTAPEVAA